MFKRLTTFAVMVLILSGSCTVGALSTKLDYQYDENKESISAPKTYTASEVYYGTDLGVGPLSNPSDIFVDENENIYIADTGNSRILVFNKEFKHIRTIDSVKENENPTFSEPMGVYAEDGLVYICDTGNARAMSVDENDKIIRYISGENIVLVNENFIFKPEKILVDQNKNILISSSSIYQGILRFDAKNKFKNFFAPNHVEATFETFLLSLLKSFFTDEQKEGVAKQLPAPYSNIYIGSDDFIYATSENVAVGQDIKCLNSAGTNTLTFASVNSGETVYGDHQSEYKTNSFCDIHRDNDGNMLVADRNSGKLFLYDAECNLITIFGGKEERKGDFTEISAVEKLGNSYLVLDKSRASVTVMTPTKYMVHLLDAMEYYRKGEYTESEEMWEALLTENSNLPLAYCSLGRAKYHLGEYKLAMDYLEKGGDTYFYSLSLTEYRKELVSKNYVLIVVGGTAIIVSVFFLLKWIKKKLSE